MLEVIVTVAIVGLLAAVAAPRVSNGITTYRANAAAERIAADLELASSWARDHGASETVTFNTKRNAYSFSSISSSGRTTPYVVELAESPYEAVITTVEPETGSITFDGYGFSEDGLKVVISVGQSVRTVLLDAATSRVEIEGR